MSYNFLKENIMKNALTTTALILVAGLSAGASFAADSAPRARLNNVDTSPYFPKSAPSSVSRAEVKAEFFQAMKASQLPAMGEGYTVSDQPATSATSRAAVKAEYLQAQKNGTLPPMGDRS